MSSGSDPAEIILQFVKRKGLKKVLFLGSNNKAKLANVAYLHETGKFVNFIVAISD